MTQLSPTQRCWPAAAVCPRAVRLNAGTTALIDHRIASALFRHFCAPRLLVGRAETIVELVRELDALDVEGGGAFLAVPWAKYVAIVDRSVVIWGSRRGLERGVVVVVVVRDCCTIERATILLHLLMAFAVTVVRRICRSIFFFLQFLYLLILILVEFLLISAIFIDQVNFSTLNGLFKAIIVAIFLFFSRILRG